MPLNQSINHSSSGIMIRCAWLPVEKVKEHDRVECQFAEAFSFVIPKIAKYFCGIIPMLSVVDLIHVVSSKRQVEEVRCDMECNQQ